jgi:RNA polymerase sigma-70 factor, ECF subfamily
MRETDGSSPRRGLPTATLAAAATAAAPSAPPRITWATLDGFLAAVERRALRVAEIATRDRDEALDIVQDAMMNLSRSYRNRPSLEWPPLFYRILDNRIRDWQRRQTVKNRVFFWQKPQPEEDDGPDLISRVPDVSASVESRALQHEAMQKLESALRLLPQRQRQAFVLRIWEGLSVEQAARSMGCSGGSVKTHLSRALSALRQRLEGVWP